MGRAVVNRWWTMGKGVLNRSITVDDLGEEFMVTMIEWDSDAEKCHGTRTMIKCDIIEATEMLENFVRGE